MKGWGPEAAPQPLFTAGPAGYLRWASSPDD